MLLKLAWISSKICIVSIKVRFNAIHHFQSRENLLFLLPLLLLRLYTGCRLDQTLSKCIASLQKVKVLNIKDRSALRFQSFAVVLLRMRTKYA